MNLNRLFELAGINLLCEAAYDNMVIALKQKFPEQSSIIDTNLKWAKDNLEKSDRIVWYLKVLRAYLLNDINSVKGIYNFISLKQFNDDLIHFYGYNINQIETTQLANQNISELFQLFDSYIKKYKESDKAPVPVKYGDYELIKFPDGTGWWFVDRAYCKEEGRSGKHCGNVVGKHDTTQRILSLRTPNHNVILTFILLDNGFLGEMKAKANLKPQEKYHPQIMQLLLNPKIKGIKGAGYAPWMNFSIFDLSEQNIHVLINHGKQSFISDQIKSEPTEFLKAPNYIKDNKEYQQIAIKALPALRHLIDNEKDLDAWEKAIDENESLIIYAPQELNDFQDRVIYYLNLHPTQLIKCPKYISYNFDINKEIIEYNYENIEYILPTVPKYAELCKLAVTQSSYSLEYIPKEYRTLELCKIAVSGNNRHILQYIPFDNFSVDEQFQLCKIVVSKSSEALRDVPFDNFSIDEQFELCKLAVSKHGSALQYVRLKLFDQNKQLELCKLAVSNNGVSLGDVPKELRTYELCKLAVSDALIALHYVPDEFKDKIKQEFNIQESVDFKYFQNL